MMPVASFWRSEFTLAIIGHLLLDGNGLLLGRGHDPLLSVNQKQTRTCHLPNYIVILITLA
jgi:hypothetical protein